MNEYNKVVKELRKANKKQDNFIPNISYTLSALWLVSIVVAYAIGKLN